MSESRLAVVTGGNTGIGFEIARGLMLRGVHVVLAVRNPKKGDDAAKVLAASTNRPLPDVMIADFSLPASVRLFATDFLTRHGSLDILVNNAGIWSTSRRETADGVEVTWATNQLGYFLTTQLLLPALKEAPAGRIVSVASELARGLDLTDTGFKRRPYSGVAAYGQSKQANRMWTRALARFLSGTRVCANSLHPGGVATGIYAKGGGIIAKIVGAGIGLVAKTPQEGADTAVWLATSDEVEGKTGGYYVDRKLTPCQFENEAEEEKLWALCAASTVKLDRGGLV